MSEEAVVMRPGKASRFAKRKKDRSKRARSDGFVLGQAICPGSDDEDVAGDGAGDEHNKKPEESDATEFLWWIRNPTVQNLGKLCRAIKCSDLDWMKEFLEFDGLGLLFQCLRNLTEVHSPHLSDMVLRMECIMCIREVANSQIGLNCLLSCKHRRDNIFGRRFAAVLENRNPIVKMQIFELMSALCLYSREGYFLTLDALEKYKTWQKLQYRFSLILNELRHADLATYQVSIMALVNSIIFANENILDRMRIRNEFIALNIEETIAVVCENIDNPDFQIQWDVFKDEMSADQEALEETKDGNVNVNNPQELFTAIYNRVRETPLSAAFVSILQSLFQINASMSQSKNITYSYFSVWNDVLKLNDPVNMKYQYLQELFAQKEGSQSQQKEKSPIRSSVTTEITLIDPKKSMNLNIFLKQFRRSNKEIVDLIRKADTRTFGVEKLKGLIKLLPQPDEIDLISNFDGNVDKLGNAEKFFQLLIQLPDFRCRLESMLLVGDFSSQLALIRPNIQLLLQICTKLTNNVALKKFLRYVLQAGNFLNKGTTSGNAVGFRISSLNKLIMTRSNVARISLLHYIVEECEKEDKTTLRFVDDLLEPLQKSTRFNLENIKSEFKQLKNNVICVRNQLNKAETEISQQFEDFMEDAECDLEEVEKSIERLDKCSRYVARHFCENERTFNLAEFLEVFREFCVKVKNCQQENVNRLEQAKKMEQRLQNQSQLAERRKVFLPKQEDRKIVDNLVCEIRRGKVLRRLSMRNKGQLHASKKGISV
ncbi:inverted formin-2 [Octopus bimaculoides]|nr:inverted formin-2 [Octopus bimaculoides]